METLTQAGTRTKAGIHHAYYTQFKPQIYYHHKAMDPWIKSSMRRFNWSDDPYFEDNVFYGN